jgi:chemotaxis protein MotB
VLGGLTIGSPGAQAVPMSQSAMQTAQMAMRQPDEGDDGDQGGTAGGDAKQQDDDTPQPKPVLDDNQLEKQFAAREERRFEAAERALREAMKDVPDLAKLADNLLIENTPEGLRIQLVDQDKQPMYPLGSAELLDPAKKLIALISQVVQRMPNKLAISGHTDSTGYPIGGKYSNWELSTDRANAARREFLADGVRPDRISRVAGLADQDPLVPSDPASPRNRRISIVLLREAKDAAAVVQVAQPTPH